ncbi:MAG: sugar phosphate isomerase/epimerase [Tannerella sp.]|jgi:sugar phosphate isomerase/epimerase|nr:sugar phosphate isomerase/epimerase [Tannerella sp.]
MDTKKTVLSLFFLLAGSLSLFSQDLSERIGVCTSVKNAPAMQKAGCSYVEIGINGFLIPDKPDTDFAANLKDASEAVLPLYSGNIFFPGEIKLTGPEVNQETVLRYTETAMRRAKQVGVKIAVLGSGKARAVEEGADRAETVARFAGLCREIALIAGKYDVVVVIEPLRREETNFINTVREGMEIVRAVNHPNLCVLADFYHMACVDEDAQALVEAGASLRHCHIAEKEKRTAPGVKGDDFTPYFKALKQIGYQGNLSLECQWTNFDEEVIPAVAEVKRQIRSVY